MLFSLQGYKRRFLYVVAHQGIAISISSLIFFVFSEKNYASSFSLAIVAGLVAALWGLLFNAVFECWEKRQTTKGRSLKRRVAHALGFETGLIMCCIPLFAWWLDISIKQAFVMEMGFVVFYMCYTFSFNWLFDILFGLPASAQKKEIVPELKS